MGRLNGPYSYRIGLAPNLWDILDKDSNQIAVCTSGYYAQIVATALTDQWRRQKQAIEDCEPVPKGGVD